MRIKCEKGNMILEMLLCIPLALLFLFIAIDAGLHYIERGRITSTIRSGVRVAIASLENRELGGSIEIEEALHEKALSAAEHIENQFITNKSEKNANSKSSIRINITPVELLINTIDGSASKDQLTLLSHLSAIKGNPSLQLEGKPAHTESSRLAFLSNALHLSSEESTSLWALPVASSIALADTTNKFLDRRYFLYIEIDATTAGLNEAFLESFLGRLFNVSYQDTIALQAIN